MTFEQINTFLGHYQPLIATLGVVLAVSVWLVDKNMTQDSYESMFITEACLNLEVANVLGTAKDGDIYVFNMEYNTSYIRENLPGIYKVIDRHGYDKNNLFQVLSVMESANHILQRQSYQPSNQISFEAKRVTELFGQLGIVFEDSNCGKKTKSWDIFNAAQLINPLWFPVPLLAFFENLNETTFGVVFYKILNPFFYLNLILHFAHLNSLEQLSGV